MQDCILKSSKYNEERKEKPKEEEIFDFKMQSQATEKNFIFPKCSKKTLGGLPNAAPFLKTRKKYLLKQVRKTLITKTSTSTYVLFGISNSYLYIDHNLSNEF